MSSSVIAFIVILAIFGVVTIRAALVNRSPESHYVASRRVSGWQNGLALIAEFVSSASLLGISGGVALTGYAGFYLGAGPPIGFLLLMLLIAVPLRRAGRFTVADALARAFPSRALRTLSALTALTVSVFFMLSQFVAGGVLLQTLFGLSYTPSVLIVGVSMGIVVFAGGMLAATRIQVIKTILMMIAVIVLFVGVLVKVGGNPFHLFSGVHHQYGLSAILPAAGGGSTADLDTISVVVAVALGVAGLPHVMIRFLTVRDERAARSSARLACWTISIYLVLVVLLGFGAAMFVGRSAIASASPGGTLTIVQLADHLFGSVGKGIIAGLIFAVIIPVLAGVVIACSGAIGQDLYTNVVRNGEASERDQMRAARFGVVIVVLIGMAISLFAKSVNLAFLGSLAFAVAASTNLPVIVFGLYWRRFNTMGAVIGMGVGLISSVALIVLGPNVLGGSAPFPLSNPAIVTVPLGFLAAAMGSLVPATAPEEAPAAGEVLKA